MRRVGFIAIILAFIFISSFTYGQKGFLRGRIIDESTGEALTGVTVVAPDNQCRHDQLILMEITA
jgi:hypothetical protein